MPPLEWWRDLLVTIWAAISIIQACLLVLLTGATLVLLLKLRGRVASLLDTIQETLNTAKETAGTARETATAVRGTAIFITDYLVKPVIAFASLIAGTRRAVAALARLARKESKADEA